MHPIFSLGVFSVLYQDYNDQERNQETEKEIPARTIMF